MPLLYVSSLCQAFPFHLADIRRSPILHFSFTNQRTSTPFLYQASHFYTIPILDAHRDSILRISSAIQNSAVQLQYQSSLCFSFSARCFLFLSNSTHFRCRADQSYSWPIHYSPGQCRTRLIRCRTVLFSAIAKKNRRIENISILPVSRTY